MIVRHGTLWTIAVLVLFAGALLSESVKLRKPRKRTTTRTPHQQSRIAPVIIRVMHKYDDDNLARGASAGCTNGNCRNKFNEAISEEENFFTDEETLRYVVHPEKYEHFVLRKNTGHRYKRDFESPELNTNQTRDNDTRNAEGLVRVPLYRIENAQRGNLSTLKTRTMRSLDFDYSLRRNDSDYYAQRKAVMERYYARQREINARYANRTNVIPRYSDVSQNRWALSNASLFDDGRVNLNSRNSTGFRFNKIPAEDKDRNVASRINLGFKTNADLSETRSSGNIERNVLDYFTPTPCTNLSSSGTLPPKMRSKHVNNRTRESEDCDRTSNNDLAEGDQRWGKCQGKIVYQHNLLLGLTGPSNLDALFEVIIQGPVCITCVEALRYNETRATVALDSGGRGHEYAKLRLQGYENEGFSYIIRVWGVKKIGEVCDVG